MRTVAAALALSPAGVPAQSVPARGRRLFADVRAYASRPHHRTGSAEERASVAWFESELKAAGATVTRRRYDFPMYDWSARLRAGGRDIDCLPLWYEGEGEIATDSPFLRPVTLPNNFDKRDIALALAEAQSDQARLVILATFGRFLNGPHQPALIACNVDPGARRSGIPTLLVSGSELDTLAVGPVSATFAARTIKATSENLLARFGSGERPLLIATPLSGWFACAGERGTGIAIALELAREFARHHPLVVVGTTGHELENFGLRRLLDAGLGIEPRAILHIGASLAAGERASDGSLQLSPLRFATSVNVQRLDAALDIGGFARAERFLGEGAVWARAFPGLPLLSFAGSFRGFHTPADLPEAVTSPALLERVYESVRAAIERL